MAEMKNDNACNEYYEDEIDLLELLKVLWKRKILILAIVTITSVAAVFYSLSLDNIYESRAILKPAASTERSALSTIRSNLGPFAGMLGVGGGNSSDPAADIFHSLDNIRRNQKFIADMVKKYQLEKDLFEDFDENKSNKNFMEHYDYIVFKSVSGLINMSQDQQSNYITLSVQHKNAEFAKRLIDVFLLESSNYLGKTELKNIDKKIENYKREIASTSDITLKNNLSGIVAGLIQSKVLAKVQDYYGFTIISKPFVADSLDKVRPRRSVICMLSFITSIIAAIFLSFFIEYIKNLYVHKIKEHYPKKIKERGSC
ncbi:MAG: Wzz/FepE/Etk N-terminal domain-containing protein [bacterium]